MTSRRIIRGSAILWVLCCSAVRCASAADDAAAPPGRISGTIVLEGGEPSKTKGWLQFVRKPPEGPERTYPESNYQGEFNDKFSFTAQTGTIWIKYFAEGYAPTWTGPLEVAPGQNLDTVRLVLRRGSNAQLKIRSADRKPIPRAKVLAMPLIEREPSGPVKSLRANQAGELMLKHVADTPYYVRVSAPGFEPLIVDEFALSHERANDITLTPSQPATGTILDTDGKPIQGAKVRRRDERTPDGRARVGAGSTSEILATTDAAGHFSIDQLITGWQYVFVVERPDGSRVGLRTLRAGIEGVQVRLPKDQRLRLRILGDLGQLPKRKEKPYVEIDQWIDTGWDSKTSIDGAAKPREVTPTDFGGVVEHHGLVSGTVQVSVAGRLHTFDVVENGPTEVSIDLEKGTAK